MQRSMRVEILEMVHLLYVLGDGEDEANEVEDDRGVLHAR